MLFRKAAIFFYGSSINALILPPPSSLMAVGTLPSEKKVQQKVIFSFFFFATALIGIGQKTSCFPYLALPCPVLTFLALSCFPLSCSPCLASVYFEASLLSFYLSIYPRNITEFHIFHLFKHLCYRSIYLSIPEI